VDGRIKSGQDEFTIDRPILAEDPGSPELYQREITAMRVGGNPTGEILQPQPIAVALMPAAATCGGFSCRSRILRRCFSADGHASWS
jgi:hypothetical protein